MHFRYEYALLDCIPMQVLRNAMLGRRQARVPVKNTTEDGFGFMLYVGNFLGLAIVAGSVGSSIGVLATGLMGWMGLAIGTAVAAIGLFLLVAKLTFRPEPGRDQRPFYICPECTAYNSKNESGCWRCNHDL